jgi:transcriptional regulator with XRE-family HTH domain
MSERALIVAELKRALRKQGLTYSDVAQQLDLSVASVKRLFSTGDFTLERVERIAELIGLGLGELLANAQEHATPTNQLTLEQEREIVSDPKLLFITWLVTNRMPLEEIVRSYRFTEREVLRYLIRLDRLKVIELQPHNRVRLLVSRRFSWSARGPVQNYIHEKLLREFVASHFNGPHDEFFFHGGPVSKETLESLRRALRNAARECVEIMDRERSPPEARHGAAFVLALRPWVYSGFGQYDRPPK